MAQNPAWGLPRASSEATRETRQAALRGEERGEIADNPRKTRSAGHRGAPATEQCRGTVGPENRVLRGFPTPKHVFQTPQGVPRKKLKSRIFDPG